jgi:hypothetical protein
VLSGYGEIGELLHAAIGADIAAAHDAAWI